MCLKNYWHNVIPLNFALNKNIFDVPVAIQNYSVNHLGPDLDSE